MRWLRTALYDVESYTFPWIEGRVDSANDVDFPQLYEALQEYAKIPDDPREVAR